MRRMWAAASALVLVLSGCSGIGPFRPNPNDEDPLYGAIPVVKAPQKDRCGVHGAGGVRASCDEAKYLATEYTRRLSVGDEVCLEGGYGEEPGGACLARAAVIDTAPNQVKLEVRGAKPDSRWFDVEMRHAWYEEGALVDLYLSERGY
ncbi:hypothetical protein HPC49_21015 [Pyxidicoccus fallax]|uniref:Lipoprotein n=1 Tax=Pyxidicoccus fallax TaxID=394095 RepID=A0A848LPZ1_9BACT|nr:hypothetical protein [Pyxidicoccus fallax]NMO19761.1 hypothetical protein [Pyxidicoccus fallax]NPC80695.1 hypothetical protein [Pyxidicoccus fallax]